MAPHSSTLAWKIPWTEEPGRLQSMGSLRVRPTERFHFHFSLSCIGEGNGNPLRCSCLENPRDGGAWWAAVYGVAQSRPWLKWLSSLAAGSTTIEKTNDFHLSIKSPSQGNLLLTHSSQRMFGVFLRKEYFFSVHLSLFPQMLFFSFIC